MNRGVYPGSFDPITNGHLDIIRRSARIFDEVIVAVLINPDKSGFFSVQERVEFIERCTKDLPNVKVRSFRGLLIDFMEQNGSKVIIKGLRAVSDFEYEFKMALMNNKLNSEIETVFMMTNSEFSYLSSSSVKQVAMFGGCIKELVPEIIIKDIMKKVEKNNKGFIINK